MKKIKDFLFDNMFFTLTVLVVFGLFTGVIVGNVISTSIKNEEYKSTAQTENTDDFSEKIVTEKTTIIVFNKTFTKNNYKTSDEVLIPSDKVGMTQTMLQEDYPTWDIDSFSASRVVMSKKIDSYPSGYYKISSVYNIDSEYVAVFTFDDDGRESIYKITKTPIDLLDNSTIKQIKSGIIVEGEEELNRKLENYVD